MALALTSVLTLEIAIMPPPDPPRPVEMNGAPQDGGCWVRAPEPRPEPTCATAHALVVSGHINGGASTIHLAGPILYTDVATDLVGDFYLRVPVDGNVCELLTQPTHYVFGEDVAYTIRFE